MASAPHERMPVYKLALEANAIVERVARGIPDQRNDLKDQLRRAVASVALNLAEGSDEFSPAEKARFYRMARRSAAEVLAVLDVCDVVLTPPPSTEAARTAIRNILPQLSGLVRNVEARRRSSRT